MTGENPVASERLSTVPLNEPEGRIRRRHKPGPSLTASVPDRSARRPGPFGRSVVCENDRVSEAHSTGSPEIPRRHSGGKSRSASFEPDPETEESLVDSRSTRKANA